MSDFIKNPSKITCFIIQKLSIAFTAISKALSRKQNSVVPVTTDPVDSNPVDSDPVDPEDTLPMSPRISAMATVNVSASV